MFQLFAAFNNLFVWIYFNGRLYPHTNLWKGKMNKLNAAI